MLTNWRRPVILLAGVLVLLLVGAVVYFLLPPRQTRSIALPPDDATPEQVVRAYLDAMDAHDCTRAASLTTDDMEERRWCEDLRGVSVFKISPPYEEKPKWSGRSPEEQVVSVPVNFELSWRWRPFNFDPTMDGVTTWGYLLVRTSSDTPWRIFSQGVG